MPHTSAFHMRPVLLGSIYRAAVLRDSPAVYFPLDEASGTSVANLGPSASGTHGAAVAFLNNDSVQLAPVPKYGAGGATGFTTFPSVINAPTALSFEFWARKNIDMSANVTVYAINAAGFRIANVHLSWVDGTIYWDCGRGGTSFDVDRISKVRDFTVTDWHHYVFTKNNTTGVMNIYVDGSLWHTGSGLTMPIGTQTVGSIGSDPSGGNALDGQVCHFAVYLTELTSTQVATHYAAAVKRTASGTLTLKFDIRPDINSGGPDTTTQALTVNGTSIGTFTSNPANAAGPASWVTRTYDITSLVTIGNMVSITTAYSSGADTGYFRNVYIQDSNGELFYGGYPSGGLYTPPFSLTGGANEYLWAQGGGAPNQFSALTSSYLSNPSGDNLGHYYIPTRTLTAAL